ncbi:hypothetical protein BaRGS_00004326 [Batillaria attramentaria]|uniref:Uncharacterized protein n=1 Tax=Batillaria attramentaria TaxID=370345 RepID=A0ABD0LY45_9CAEN
MSSPNGFVSAIQPHTKPQTIFSVASCQHKLTRSLCLRPLPAPTHPAHSSSRPSHFKLSRETTPSSTVQGRGKPLPVLPPRTLRARAQTCCIPFTPSSSF